MDGLISYDALVDLYTVAIDKTLPVDEKTMDFVRQVKTPHQYRVGNVRITARFPYDAPKLTSGYTRLRA